MSPCDTFWLTCMLVRLYSDTEIRSKRSRLEVFCKKGVLRNFANFTENTCARVSFLMKLHASGLSQVFSCEFCEIYKNTFSYRTPPVPASVDVFLLLSLILSSYKLQTHQSILSQTPLQLCPHFIYCFDKPEFVSL